MSARSSRFSGFGSRRRRGKAAAAVIACAVMLLAGCGGSVSGGEATDAPVVRGDTLGSDWATTPGLVSASSPGAGQVVVSWDKQVEEDPTEKVIGYVVQVTSIFVDHNGPWTGASTGCANSETQSSTTKTCTVTGLADGSYAFNVAAVRKNVLTKNTRTAVVSMASNSVTLLSPPGIPATPTVVVGDSMFTVTVAAGTTGGIPTSYTVTPTPATTPPITCTVTGASASCPVTGLADSTAYTFTATAKNASSTEPSLPSAASDKAQYVTVSGTPTTAVFGTQTPISLTTTGGSSGAVTFTVTGTGCTVTGTSLTATRAGTCTVTATQGAHKSTAAFPFTAPASHTVTFDSNGVQQEFNSDGTQRRGSANVKVSQAATSTSVLRANTFSAPDGREFSGWATTSTGPVDYVTGDSYAFTADAYLYAVWGCSQKAAHWEQMDAKRTSEHNATLSYSIDLGTQGVEWTSFTGSTAGGDHATTEGPEGKTGEQGSVLITGLNKDSAYDFTLTATNNVGCTYTSKSDHTPKYKK